MHILRRTTCDVNASFQWKITELRSGFYVSIKKQHLVFWQWSIGLGQRMSAFSQIGGLAFRVKGQQGAVGSGALSLRPVY